MIEQISKSSISIKQKIKSNQIIKQGARHRYIPKDKIQKYLDVQQLAQSSLTMRLNQKVRQYRNYQEQQQARKNKQIERLNQISILNQDETIQFLSIMFKNKNISNKQCDYSLPQSKDKKTIFIRIKQQQICQNSCEEINHYIIQQSTIIQFNYICKQTYPNMRNKQQEEKKYYILWKFNWKKKDQYYTNKCDTCKEQVTIKFYKKRIIPIFQAICQQIFFSLVQYERQLKKGNHYLNKNTQVRQITQKQRQEQYMKEILKQKEILKYKQIEKKSSTFYPYPKKYINSLFRKKDDYKKPLYSEAQAQNYILKQLIALNKYGYDFQIETHSDFSKQTQYSSFKKKLIPLKPKQMHRKIYLKMKCRYCKNQGRNKIWTSILGLGQINFIDSHLEDIFKKNPKFQSIRNLQKNIQKYKYPRCIRWNMKFYRMKCKDCDNWGDPYIFGTQLEAFSKSFCYIISKILDYCSDQRPRFDKRNKIIEEMHKHQSELCQACQLGVCYNVGKGEQGKKQQI